MKHPGCNRHHQELDNCDWNPGNPGGLDPRFMVKMQTNDQIRLTILDQYRI